MDNITEHEKELLSGIIRILSHPEVKKIGFCIPSSNYARALKQILNEQTEEKSGFFG